MTFVYLICFLLVTAGVILLLKLTPEKITDDLMHFVSPKQTLRDTIVITAILMFRFTKQVEYRK